MLLAVLVAVPAASQTVRLAPDAEVRSIRYRFTGPHELTPEELSNQMATTAPGGLDGVHSAVAWIPLIPDPARHRFDPVILQEDAVRLRRHYRRQGFLHATVDYEARTDKDRRFVDITFLIEEGAALRLRSARMAAPDGSDVVLVEEVRSDVLKRWERLGPQFVGRRFREEEMARLQSNLQEVFANAGYLGARIEPRAAIDSVAHQVDLVWVVDLESRSRFGPITIEGVTKVPESLAARQLGFETGDLTSRRAIEDGRSNLMSVELFRSAEVSVGKGAGGDSLLPVHVTIREDHPRFTTIEAGYVTDGAGISGQLRWTHPNFTGGARSLNAIALFQTGWWSTSDIPDRLLRTTLVLNQPYVGSPRVSLGFGPSFEFRDGYLDRSVAGSVQSTLVWRFNPLQSAALRYEFTHRQVDESRGRDLATGSKANVTYAALGSTALLDSLSEPVLTSLFSLNTSLGGLDDIARPQRGAVFKPNLSITSPSAWGTIEFSRVDLQATAFAPLPGRSNAVMLRGNLGGLWPFGKSIPEPGTPAVVEVVRLRDHTLTAGGANDVRGYATRMLGPKVPRIEGRIEGADTILTSDSYTEVGGFRRWTATVELRLGLPRLSRDIFLHLFGDAGRVWTPDGRFEIQELVAVDDQPRYTTGGGFGYYTAVGAIRFDFGYKLNPSTLDVRDPQDVLNAIRAGQDPSAAPVDSRRRHAFHLALGLFF